MAKLAAGHAALTPRGNVVGPRSSRVPNRTRTAPRSAGRSSYTLRAARPCADVRVWCACDEHRPHRKWNIFFCKTIASHFAASVFVPRGVPAAAPPGRVGAGAEMRKSVILIEGRNSVARGETGIILG